MPEVKTDCFGYKSDRECRALNELFCRREDCAFYKTKAQYEEDLKKYPKAGKVSK